MGCQGKDMGFILHADILINQWIAGQVVIHQVLLDLVAQITVACAQGQFVNRLEGTDCTEIIQVNIPAPGLVGIRKAEMIPVLPVKAVAEQEVGLGMRDPGQGRPAGIGILGFSIIGRVINIFIVGGQGKLQGAMQAGILLQGNGIGLGL